MRRVVCVLSLWLAFLLLAAPALAETVVIKSTGTYVLGDNDTKLDGKRMALLEAKRLALERAGTYVQSVSEVKNYVLTSQEIHAFTAGIVEVKELEEKTEFNGRSLELSVEVEVKIDPADVARQIADLRRSREIRKELEQTRLEKEKLEKEVADLNVRLSSTTDRKRAAAIQNERQAKLEKIDVEVLLGKAWVAFKGPEGGKGAADPAKGRQEALRLLDEALQVAPKNPRAHKLYADVLFAAGRRDEAIIRYRKAIILDGGYVFAHNNLGVALLSAGKPKKAIEEYLEALRLDPLCAQARFNLGVALQSQGQLDGAIREYVRAAKIDPEDPDIRYNLGNALLERGRPKKAAEEFRKALELDPEYAQARNNLGLALKSAGHLKEAVAEFEKAAEERPENADVHYNLGIALDEMGKEKEAVAALKRYLECSKSSKSEREYRARATEIIRDLKKAETKE